MGANEKTPKLLDSLANKTPWSQGVAENIQQKKLHARQDCLRKHTQNFAKTAFYTHLIHNKNFVKRKITSVSWKVRNFATEIQN